MKVFNFSELFLSTFVCLSSHATASTSNNITTTTDGAATQGAQKKSLKKQVVD